MIERVKPSRVPSFLEPPLLNSEPRSEFEQLRRELEQEINPRGIIEKQLVADLAYLMWEIARLRRAKAAILNTARRIALQRILDQLMNGIDDFSGEHEDLAERWFTNEQAKAKVARILERHGLDESAIDAEVIRVRLPELEAYERLNATAQRRFDQTLYLLGEYRGGLGVQLRAATTKMIEHTTRTLEDTSSKKS